MNTTTRNIHRSVGPLPLAITALVIALAGCGGSATDRAASERDDGSTPPATAVQEAITPPTTNSEGGFGLPEAEEITSLGLEGVTEVTFPETCEIELVALDAAIGSPSVPQSCRLRARRTSP